MTTLLEKLNEDVEEMKADAKRGADAAERGADAAERGADAAEDAKEACGRNESMVRSRCRRSSQRPNNNVLTLCVSVERRQGPRGPHRRQAGQN